MIKGSIRFLDGSPAISVVIGAGEDVKAPRDLALLEKQGWVVDDSFTATYKAWLAAKRQGDVPTDSKFDQWIDNVEEVELRPSRKQIEQAVAIGSLEADKAEKMLALWEADEQGEAQAPPA